MKQRFEYMGEQVSCRSGPFDYALRNQYFTAKANLPAAGQGV